MKCQHFLDGFLNIELGHSVSSIKTSLLLTKQKLPILKSVTMTILRVTNKTPEEKTIIPERDFLMVQKPFLDPVSLPTINGTDKLTARLMTQDTIILIIPGHLNFLMLYLVKR